MEEKKKIMNKGLVIGVSVFVVVIIAFIFLVSSDVFKLGSDVTYEEEQYTDYLTSLKASISKSNYSSVEDATSAFLKENQKLTETFGNGLGTSSASMKISETITSGNFLNTEDLTNKLLGLIDSMLGTNLEGKVDEGITQSVVSLSSTTACNTVESKYCISNNGLSAKVYVVDKNSDKWAVLLHGVLMNGKQIYNAIGDIYSSQGYNVLAPDLRGFGDSEGSVAMGYLESLDVYDWLKDLNANYSRYGVNVAPRDVVVHGVSLGAATTLQLATNPDIAAKKGEPYTKTLTELNVKGFVDDCGYTSMTGIITGMLSLGDSSQITSLLGNLGIDINKFMPELEKALASLSAELGKILKTDLTSQFDFSNLTGIMGGISGSDTQNFLDEMNKFSGFFDEALKNQGSQNPQNNQNNQNSNNLGGFFGGWSGGYGSSNNWFGSQGSQNNSGQGSFPSTDKYEGYIESGKEMYENLFKNFNTRQTSNTSSNNAVPTLMANNMLDSLSSFSLDDIVPKLLMKLVGIGLTEENYDLYSNVFAGNRNFPSGTKVVVIHGSADTTVPPSNAKTIAEKAGNRLLYNWSVSGAPHAFVVVGSHKEEYTNLVGNFTKCISENKCNAFNGSTSPLNSIVD